MKKVHIGLGSIVVALVCAAIAGYSPVELFGLVKSGAQGILDWLRSTEEAAGAWGPLVFGGLHISFLMLMFPAGLLSTLAGTIFGFKLGALIILVDDMIAAMLAYYIGQWIAKKLDQRKKDSHAEGDILEEDVVASNRLFDVGQIKKLGVYVAKQCENNGFQAMLTMRLLALPYMPISYAAGFMKQVKFRDFFWATLLVDILGAGLYAYLGDSFHKGPKAIIIAASLIAISLLIPRIVGMVTKKKGEGVRKK